MALLIKPILHLDVVRRRSLGALEVSVQRLSVAPAMWDASWDSDYGVTESWDHYSIVDEVGVVSSFKLRPDDAEDDAGDFLEQAEAAAGHVILEPVENDLLSDWLSEVINFDGAADEKEEDHEVEDHDDEVDEEIPDDTESDVASMFAEDFVDDSDDPEATLLVELGLVQGADGEYIDAATGRVLGSAHVFSSEWPMISCVCKMHGNCKLVWSARLAYQEKWLDGLRWLQHGAGDTAEKHAERARDIKMQYGISSRRKPLPSS